jgi:phosphoserine phosphatase RsbU-like protein/GAF domain-containing protein
VSFGADTGTRAFRRAYASALSDYLRTPGEASLHVAYELGREAVTRQLSVLDLAVTHQEALLSALADTLGAAKARHLTRAAGDFFLEALSTFEMIQRGFTEARKAVLVERRQTELSRQLSTFLADASLALDASESLEEMLRLVAEQARELVGADCCVATVAARGQPRSAEAASYPGDDRRWTMFVRWLDRRAIYELLRQSGGSTRMTGEQLAQLPPFGTADSERPLRGWLAASLTTLDGSELGAIQLFDKHEGGFTAGDEAALVHLAQMASAAVERSRLYQDRGPLDGG